MKRGHGPALRRLLAGALVGWWGMLAVQCLWGQIPLATDRPQPHEPEESARLIRVPPGFRVEVVASEPLLADPVDMAFDHRGRIFVCEIHGYNLEGYYDIRELNRSGVLDTAVRRVDASLEAQARAELGQYGTVKLLEDADGDGRYDTVTVWADRLPPCYGVAAARDGVIVICPPEILYLGDPDGDGVPEVREVLVRTPVGPMWDRPSAPRWNLDNWIYYDAGFRLRSDGSAHEPASGTGQFGQTTSDWGDRFYIVQVQPVRYVVPLAYRYLARNPYHAARADTQSLLDYTDVYPISRPDPWRSKRGEDPAWLRFYGADEATPNGIITSACGPLIYRARLFPSEYWGNYFFCENAQNLIHRCLLLRDGAGYRVARASEERVEFLASTEEWFRPVNLTLGPDGAIYIVDMYREIIEDYSAIPRHLQQQYVESLIAGHDRGRILRLTVEGAPAWRPFDLSSASVDELVRLLANDNAWWRETAQRLLVERGDRAAVGLLHAMLRDGPTPEARLHALCTLDGLQAIDPSCLEFALQDEHFAVRLHAVRLSEPWLDRAPGVRRLTIERADDADAKVRLQVALSLGESRHVDALRALARIAGRWGDEPWMRDALLSSVGETADQLLPLVVCDAPGGGPGQRLVFPLAATIGARRDEEQLDRVLDMLVQWGDLGLVEQQTACLDGLVDGLRRGQVVQLRSERSGHALRRLLAAETGGVVQRAIHVAGLLRFDQSPEMQAALQTATSTATDEDASVAERRRALLLLSAASWEQLAAVAAETLDPRQPLDVQLATVEALSACEHPHVGSVLLAPWSRLTPGVQQAVMEAVFGHRNRLMGLLDALERGDLPPASLEANRRRQLERSPDEGIRQRIAGLSQQWGATPGRAEVLERFQAAVSLPRDPQRGRQVFEQQCAKCHVIEGQGYAVGPDLAVTRTRADDVLVSDIMDPSAELTVGYQHYNVITQEGRIFGGVLTAETATSVTLRREEGVEDVILRRDIDEMSASPISMMPEDLEKLVSPQDVADLIGFLRTAFAAEVPASRVVLFDDDIALVHALWEGDGTIGLCDQDFYSGVASLLVTPPQRFASAIDGWQYRIAEHPGPGEFRYLRFAWKTNGEGIMVELAADGTWPAPDQADFRYHSGRNTTSWTSRQVSGEPPEEWTVVVCDLWRDCGAFVLTGIAPTAMGGDARFDAIELFRSLDEVERPR